MRVLAFGVLLSAWRLLTASASSPVQLDPSLYEPLSCYASILFKSYISVILNHSAHLALSPSLDKHIYVAIGLNFWIRQRHIQGYYIFDNHSAVAERNPSVRRRKSKRVVYQVIGTWKFSIKENQYIFRAVKFRYWTTLEYITKLRHCSPVH